MANPATPNDELHTWNQIAAYLRISVREAQYREKSDGLPVHRMPGKKPQVWAYRLEVDAWKSQITAAGSFLPGGVPADQNSLLDPPNAAPDHALGEPRRRLLNRRLIVAGIGVTAAAGLAAARILGRQRQPERAVASGNLLTALDGLGRTVWTYRFTGTPRYNNPQSWQVQVVDAEGCGRPGVLVAQNFIPAPGADESGQGELFYFDADGKLKWTVPARPDLLDFNGRPFEPAWNFGHVIVTPARGGGQTIWAAVRHSIRWPGCVLRIDAMGSSRIHYANAGNVEHLTYLHRDDGDFIVFSGENNAFDRSCAGLIGIDDAAAVSPPSGVPRYRFASSPQGVPRSYVLFPTTELEAARGAPYGSAELVTCNSGGVVVEVGGGGDGVHLQYELSDNLEPQNVIPSGSCSPVHRRLEKQGVLQHSWADCPELKKPLILRRFEAGRGWRDEAIPWRLPNNTV